MAITLKSGATTDEMTVDPTSKAGRVTLYDSSGREISAGGKITFAMSGIFTPPATPTDMVTIFGSASKVVRVVAFWIFTTNTAAGSQAFYLIKRNANNTTGTFVAGTAVPLDSADDGATATAFGHYTANPGGLGAAAGTIHIIRAGSTAALPATFAGVRELTGQDMLAFVVNRNLDKLVTLRGTAQGLCLNFNGAALVAGQTHTYTVVWIEE